MGALLGSLRGWSEGLGVGSRFLGGQRSPWTVYPQVRVKLALIESCCPGNLFVFVVCLKYRRDQLEPAKDIFDVFESYILFLEAFVQVHQAKNLRGTSWTFEQNTFWPLT